MFGIRCTSGPWPSGHGLMLGNVRVLGYGALVWLGFHLFVLAYEEPTLRASFGAEYEAFCAGVPARSGPSDVVRRMHTRAAARCEAGADGPDTRVLYGWSGGFPFLRAGFRYGGAVVNRTVREPEDVGAVSE
jgi:hypothetical protein